MLRKDLNAQGCDATGDAISTKAGLIKTAMKKYITGFIYSLPIQLFLLHFRRNQVLLVFWYILFATVSGNFLQTYGANSLYLAPEYMGNVNALSMSFVGFAIAVFIMSWNITTFILHCKHITFLATTAQPFLKFCINNALLPLAFLVVYFCFAIPYVRFQELLGVGDILILSFGFLAGLILAIAIAFLYFFRADKRIYRGIQTVMTTAHKNYEKAIKKKPFSYHKGEMRVDWFLSASLKLRKPRNVVHYSQEFLDSIFKRHHIAGVIAIFVAFISLITAGYFFETKIFQVPAAASITVFFSILIAVAGAISLFLRSWSIPVVLIMVLIINWMYENNIIDPRNKAYGLNYTNPDERPDYNQTSITQMASDENIKADENNFLNILNNWKSKQQQIAPVICIIDVSGGGTRSATFSFTVLQRLDSLTHGELMKHTIIINGASGGIIGAAYFRALYLERQNLNTVNLQNPKYADDISKDLLNPLFSSFVSRDIIGPVKKFEANGYKYNRDRGYAFEQQLNENTHGLLEKKLEDYKTPEENATIPSMFFNSTITRDGRRMIIGTHPLRFLMQSPSDSNTNLHNTPDAVDFISLFQKQNPLNLRVLSAVRMNATFPYALPNVWLPTNPVIDVMDAGLRDNFGLQNSLRFIDVFKDWLTQNTSKILLIQIRDKNPGDWDRPYESNNILSSITKPMLLLQSNWFKLQDYYQTEESHYLQKSLQPNFYNIFFTYVPKNENAAASISFHLTQAEKKDIFSALDSPANQNAFQQVQQLLK